MKHWKPGDKIECDMAFQADTITHVGEIPAGYIAGIASTPKTDAYGHKVLAGAFDEAIRSKGLDGPGGIMLLAHHKWDQIVGTIKRLETVKDKLRIEAQLNFNINKAKDLYEVIKMTGGLSFSVGFMLQENGFEFLEEGEDDGAWLKITKGDLMEVSIVTFPACREATMDFVKHADTPSAFEKALIANGWCLGRKEAHRLFELCRNSAHLFAGKGPPSAELPSPNHPMLDAYQLRAATDLTAKVKALLGSR